MEADVEDEAVPKEDKSIEVIEEVTQEEAASEAITAMDLDKEDSKVPSNECAEAEFDVEYVF